MQGRKQIKIIKCQSAKIKTLHHKRLSFPGLRDNTLSVISGMWSLCDGGQTGHKLAFLLFEFCKCWMGFFKKRLSSSNQTLWLESVKLRGGGKMFSRSLSRFVRRSAK